MSRSTARETADAMSRRASTRCRARGRRPFRISKRFCSPATRRDARRVETRTNARGSTPARRNTASVPTAKRALRKVSVFSETRTCRTRRVAFGRRARTASTSRQSPTSPTTGRRPSRSRISRCPARDGGVREGRAAWRACQRARQGRRLGRSIGGAAAEPSESRRPSAQRCGDLGFTGGGGGDPRARRPRAATARSARPGAARSTPLRREAAVQETRRTELAHGRRRADKAAARRSSFQVRLGARGVRVVQSQRSSTTARAKLERLAPRGGGWSRRPAGPTSPHAGRAERLQPAVRARRSAPATRVAAEAREGRRAQAVRAPRSGPAQEDVSRTTMRVACAVAQPIVDATKSALSRGAGSVAARPKAFFGLVHARREPPGGRTSGARATRSATSCDTSRDVRRREKDDEDVDVGSGDGLAWQWRRGVTIASQSGGVDADARGGEGILRETHGTADARARAVPSPDAG